MNKLLIAIAGLALVATLLTVVPETST